MEPDHVSTTRAAYDATIDFFLEKIGTEITSEIEAPIDRALLAAFAETAAADGAGLVADLGCGPGRVAAFLAARGVNVIGFDLSPVMVATARESHPTIGFEVAELTSLPLENRSLAGAVSWYSIIHTPPDHLREIAAEFARVLAPDGLLLVALQAGAGESVHRSEVGVHQVSLTSFRHDPEAVAQALIAAGFDITARTIREPAAAHEPTPQAFLFAKRAR